MKQIEQQRIQKALEAYVNRYKSQNDAAKSLKVSAATISSILSGKHELIADRMWQKIALATGCMGKDWIIVETEAFSEATLALEDAQDSRNMLWIVGEAGCGKSTTAKAYEESHREVFYILCAEDMKKGDFVREIAQKVGCRTEGKNIRELWQAILNNIMQMDAPLLIFDEADKLTESVFSYFVSMYNKLEDHAGLVYLSTDYIIDRVQRGLRYNKQGYKEFFSRIGRKYFVLEPTSMSDVVAVAKANGIEEENEVRQVVQEAAECEYDIRRVKKSVRRILKQRAA